MDEVLLNKIASNVGTPTYVYDIRKLKNRINYIKEHLPSRVEICYAIKANTFIVKDIEQDVFRFEVCSPGERKICQKMNVDDSKILISGVNKSNEEIQEIMDSSNIQLFSVESMNQFELLKNTNKKIDILLRLTSGNQFGINKSEIEEIIKNRNEYPNINIKGIQFFSGTQKTSTKILKKEVEKLEEFIKELKDKYDFTTNELEYGTGFPVYYFKNSEFDEEEYFKEFSEIINNLDYDGKIILEIGRSIVASCGYYITKIIDKKTNKDQNYAIVDGGINHVVYYGQSMAMKVPYMDIYPKRDNLKKERWNICGSLCTINDILIKQLEETIEIGDIIVFKNVGAYSATEGIALFLSRDLPKVIKLNEDNSIEIIRDNTSTYQLNS